VRAAPTIDADGAYFVNGDDGTDSGRPIRVYTRIDNRLMFEDFFAKIAAFSAH
jgi:hypothetical protein